jgi:hypothetical protein
MTELFDEFPNHARVWLYQTNIPLTEDQVLIVREKLLLFVREWAAHGSKLVGAAEVLNPCFIAFVVNENEVSASGCSIDSSVRFLKVLGQEMGIDFFTRNKVTLATSPLQQISIHELSDINASSIIYDPLINNLGELRTKWEVSIEKSSLAVLVK